MNYNKQLKSTEIASSTVDYLTVGTSAMDIGGIISYPINGQFRAEELSVVTSTNHLHLSEDEIIFRGLADKWKRETGDLSVISRRYTHLSYQAILKMGTPVVPFILKDLRRDPDRWFHALEFLTKKNPSKGASTFYEAVDRWIAWGISEGHIS